VARFLVAFDGTILFFMGALFLMIVRTSFRQMPLTAEIADAGHYPRLFLSVAVAIVILLAIGIELSGIKAGQIGLVVLAAMTVLVCWFFINFMLALHYAHEYYSGASPVTSHGTHEKLKFPGDKNPDYWDFLYFSFVIGMTFQVSDVQIMDHKVRRVVLVHGLLAFLFNVAIIALTIGLVGDQISSIPEPP
jgi:uncharacterized membrane protein